VLGVSGFAKELDQLAQALKQTKKILITTPKTTNKNSLNTQLTLHQILLNSQPHCEVFIINDEPIPLRYGFLPDIEHVHTPESYAEISKNQKFDVGMIVDGGVDRAGRLQKIFEDCETTVLIDHHIVSADYPYTIRIVAARASATTEVIYHMSKTKDFKTKKNNEFYQQVYLGLIFDTGFFRHSNTTPEAMELGARLIRSGFDFTRVGERGMLERSFDSLQLLAFTLSHAKLESDGKIIWSQLTQQNLKTYRAAGDDKEGIIDHLFLTHGIQVAALFFELPDGSVKVSFRSLGELDVAHFARSLTVQGGGHQKAAGALLEGPIQEAIPSVLKKLEKSLLA